MKLKYYVRGLGTGILVTALILGISLSHGKGSMSDEEVKKRAAELGMVEEFKSLEEASKEKENKENEANETNEEVSENKDGNKNDEGNKGEVSANYLNSNKTQSEQQKDATKEENGFGTGIEKEAQEDETNQSTDKNQNEDSPNEDNQNEDNQNEDNQNEDNQADDKKTDDKQTDSQQNDKETQLGQENSSQSDKVIILQVNGGDGSMTVAKRAEEMGLVSSAAEFDRFLCSGGYDKKICTGKHEIPVGATMEEIAKLLITKP